jgi:hypothetical protein
MSSLMAMLGLDISPFKRNLLQAQADARHAGKEIKDAFGDVMSEKLGSIASVAGIEELSRRTIEYGEKVFDTANRLGISTEAVQQWDYALRLNGSTLESGISFFERMATARVKAMQGNEAEIDAFKRLGVSIDDLKSKRLEDLGAQIAEVFRTGDAQRLIADLRTIGGRGAGELAAAFKSGLAEFLNKAPIIDNTVINELKGIADDAKGIMADFLKNMAPLVVGFYNGIRTTLFGVATSFVALKEATSAWWQAAKKGNEEFNSGKNRLANFTTPFIALGEGAKAFKETFKDAFEGKELAEDKESERLKKMQEAARKLAGGQTEEIENKKAGQEAKKVEEEILRLKQEAARITQSTALHEMTSAQRVEEIQRRISRVKAELQDAYDDKDAAQSELNLAKLNDELSRAKEANAREEANQDKKDMRANRYRAPDLNALQRIGAYVSPAETAMTDHAAKSEKHLAKIEKHLERIDKGQDKTRF